MKGSVGCDRSGNQKNTQLKKVFWFIIKYMENFPVETWVNCSTYHAIPPRIFLTIILSCNEQGRASAAASLAPPTPPHDTQDVDTTTTDTFLLEHNLELGCRASSRYHMTWCLTTNMISVNLIFVIFIHAEDFSNVDLFAYFDILLVPANAALYWNAPCRQSYLYIKPDY